MEASNFHLRRHQRDQKRNENARSNHSAAHLDLRRAESLLNHIIIIESGDCFNRRTDDGLISIDGFGRSAAVDIKVIYGGRRWMGRRNKTNNFNDLFSFDYSPLLQPEFFYYEYVKICVDTLDNKVFWYPKDKQRNWNRMDAALQREPYVLFAIFLLFCSFFVLSLDLFVLSSTASQNSIIISMLGDY